MNTRIFSAAIILAATLGTTAFAQSEEPFFPSREGTVLVYENKDASGNTNYLSEDSVTIFTGDFNNGKVTVITSQRATGEEQVLSVEKSILFKEGEVIVDMVSMMQAAIKGAMMMSIAETGASEEEMKEFEQVMENIRIKGECRGVPSKLTPGMELPDYEVSLSIMLVESKIKCNDRKVTGQESIRTEAGTFDCYIIEESVNVKTMGISEKSSTKSWYARGIGIVKEESYEKKKLVNVRELIGIR